MTNDREPIEHDLIRDGTLFDELEIANTEITPTVGNDDLHVRIEMQVDDELIESCAFGLIFVLGVLSFADARPRGVSGNWFEDDDQFTAADMIRNLRFENGGLRMYVDYLRGRCVKTRVEVAKNGRVVLDTVNRGQAATRWVDQLRGKKFLRPVASL
jgi:hypothetical protein